MDRFSKEKSDELKIVILDNGVFHKAKKLVIPPNIALTFLPPYRPEHNLAEKMWRVLKGAISMRVFPTMKDWQHEHDKIINKHLTEQAMLSITGNLFYINHFMNHFSF